MFLLVSHSFFTLCYWRVEWSRIFSVKWIASQPFYTQPSFLIGCLSGIYQSYELNSTNPYSLLHISIYNYLFYHKHLHNDVCVSLRHNTLSPSILAQTCPSKWRVPRWRVALGQNPPISSTQEKTEFSCASNSSPLALLANCLLSSMARPKSGWNLKGAGYFLASKIAKL